MGPKELLFAFENKYPFLYDICINGVPIYTCHRDAVLARLQKQEMEQTAGFSNEKGKVFPGRILEGAGKLLRLRKNKTLIFTSSMYRRDEGRNLAAEFLMEEYPDAVVFEWPSRTEAYDVAYFRDPKREKYCPLDFYIVCFKLYRVLFRRKYRQMEEECRRLLKADFAEKEVESEQEQAAVDYLLEALPVSYAETACSHAVFRWLFRAYKNIQYAIDFWGSARENIIPVLPGNPESIELQHGIITSYHPGYIYPEFVKNCDTRFFKRTLLVYGEKTKQLLTEGSIFSDDQIQVIGNPRIKMYKQLHPVQETQRKLILFASQPYEQDGIATGYYSAMLEYLREIQRVLTTDPKWEGYRLAVKLHPRENNGVSDIYRQALPDVMVYDNATQLYELLCQSFVQVTVSSTSLYEAVEFDTPTIVLTFADQNPEQIYGFKPWVAESVKDLQTFMGQIMDENNRLNYLSFLKNMSACYN